MSWKPQVEKIHLRLTHTALSDERKAADMYSF